MHDNIIIGRIDGYRVYSTGNTGVPGCCHGCLDNGVAEQGHSRCYPIDAQAKYLLDKHIASLSFDNASNEWRYSIVYLDDFKEWWSVEKTKPRY